MFSRTYQNLLVLTLLLWGLGHILISESQVIHTTDLERIQSSGELSFITRNTPTTYYIGPQGPTGFEYELASAFAHYLGVTPKVVISDEFSKILAIDSLPAHLNTFGLEVSPLGEHRLKIVEMVDHMIKTCNE